MVGCPPEPPRLDPPGGPFLGSIFAQTPYKTCSKLNFRAQNGSPFGLPSRPEQNPPSLLSSESGRCQGGFFAPNSSVYVGKACSSDATFPVIRWGALPLSDERAKCIPWGTHACTPITQACPIREAPCPCLMSRAFLDRVVTSPRSESEILVHRQQALGHGLLIN